ncbi:MAG: HIT domain-containing protein [Nitrospirae bacterium]|nr:HIT domain-containing protein [Nitrospirota bacterium]
MQYIENVAEQSGCIFCVLPKKRQDQQTLVLHRDPTCFVMMNRYPYNNAHLMVVPFRHTADFLVLEDPEKQALLTLVGHSVRILREVYKTHGLNVGVNLGRAAGAGYEDHVHFHVVPRWVGDTNFMPILGETKVISQSLSDTYRRLRPHFRSLDGR